MQGSAPMNDLSFVKAVDRFRQRVVVAVADTSDRRLNARFGETFGVFYRDILHAAIGMVDQSAFSYRTPIVRSLSA